MKSFSVSYTDTTPNRARRRFLKLAAASLATTSTPAAALFRLNNQCLDPAGTPASALETAAWQGITQTPDMHAPLRHPIQTLQHWVL